MQTPGRDRSSHAEPGSGQKPVNLIEELPELQKLAVLARLYTNGFSEAKEACLQHNYAKAYQLVGGAREQYYQKYRTHLAKEPDTRGLSKADAQKVQAKHRQLNDTLARFDRTLGLLEKLSQAKPEKQHATNQPTRIKPTVKLPEKLRQEILGAHGAEAQFNVVQTYFNTAPVQTSQQIRSGCFYSLLHQGNILLLFCENNTTASDAVEMSVALTGQEVKPILRRKLLELGKQNKLHQLDLKTTKPLASAPLATVDEPSSKVKIRTINEFFASLIPAAKASGLSVDTDAIVAVRDQALPSKKYQAAYNTINGLFLHLETQAGQLAQKIRQDELDHASGVLKMSPVEWQRKKQRDTEQTTKVNSALRYFRLALDQLNILISDGDS